MKRAFYSCFLLFASLSLTHPLPAQTDPPKPLDRLALPESSGKIEERFSGSGSRWVICIQDVHAHFTAQENIASILEQLNDEYHLSAVATEGSWSVTSYPKTWGIPSTPEKQNLLRALLEKDYISGPAYAAMSSKMPITLVGMEDAAVYEKNRSYYLKYLQKREEIASKLKTWEVRLSDEKKKNYGTDLWNFDLIFSKFQDGGTDTQTIPSVLRWADEKQISVLPYENLSLFRRVTDLEKSIQKTKLDSEAKRLLEEYKYERLGFGELLASGKIPSEKLEHYPEAKKYLELSTLQNRLSHRQLFAEIARLGIQIKEKLFTTSGERSIDAEAVRMRTARQMILMKATPEDFESYEKAAETTVPEAAQAGLTEALQNAADFYRTARERDKIFFKKITEDPRLKDNIAVVAGGFHTEGLTDKLQKAGISYLVIAPNLGKTSPDENLYEERLRETVLPSAALSAKQNRETDDQDARIADAIRALTSKEMTDLRQAVAKVVNETDRPLTGVAAEERSQLQTGFAEMPQADQIKLIDHFREMQNGVRNIVIILKASTLADLILPDRAGEARLSGFAMRQWRELIANRANHVIILNDHPQAYQKILGESLGKSVKRIPGENIDAVVAKEKRKDAPIGVIDPVYAGAPDILALKPAPASFFLIRPLLENKTYRNLFGTSEAMEALHEILMQMISGEAAQKSA